MDNLTQRYWSSKGRAWVEVDAFIHDEVNISEMCSVLNCNPWVFQSMSEIRLNKGRFMDRRKYTIRSRSVHLASNPFLSTPLTVEYPPRSDSDQLPFTICNGLDSDQVRHTLLQFRRINFLTNRYWLESRWVEAEYSLTIEIQAAELLESSIFQFSSVLKCTPCGTQISGKAGWGNRFKKVYANDCIDFVSPFFSTSGSRGNEGESSKSSEEGDDLHNLIK